MLGSDWSRIWSRPEISPPVIWLVMSVDPPVMFGPLTETPESSPPARVICAWIVLAALKLSVCAAPSTSGAPWVV